MIYGPLRYSSVFLGLLSARPRQCSRPGLARPETKNNGDRKQKKERSVFVPHILLLLRLFLRTSIQHTTQYEEQSTRNPRSLLHGSMSPQTVVVAKLT